MESISAIRSATLGMTVGTRQLDAAAAAVAQASVLPGPTAVTTGGGAGDAVAGGGADLTGGMVAEMMAVRVFGLNAAVARTVDEMLVSALSLGNVVGSTGDAGR